jgi:hypothetical protein
MIVDVHYHLMPLVTEQAVDRLSRDIKDLPTRAPAGIRLTEEEMSVILGGNAAAVLGRRAGPGIRG